MAVSTDVINCSVCTGMESRLLDVRNSIHCHLVITPLWAHIFPSESQPPTPALCLTKWKSGAAKGIRGPWFLKLNRVFSSCFFEYLNQNDPGHLKELSWDLASFPSRSFHTTMEVSSVPHVYNKVDITCMYMPECTILCFQKLATHICLGQPKH